MSEQTANAPDWLAHGPLEVSPNGHYVQHKDGTPFFWMADTQWVLNRLTDENVGAVLDDRKKKGFTAVQICAVRHWKDAEGVGGMEWSAMDTNDQLPFADNDPLRWNRAYWDRWRAIIGMAAERGLYVVMMAGGPGRGDEPWVCKDNNECCRYGKLVGEFFRGVPNLIYSASMDLEGTMGVGAGGWRAIARGILDGDGGPDCFLTYHPYTTSSKWFHRDGWLRVNGIQGSRNETADNDILIYQRIYGDYARTDPVKPVVLLEGSYEQERNDWGTLPPTSPRNVRMQFFYCWFAGGAGYTYGHCKQWQQYQSVDYLASEGARQVALAAEFLLSREWWSMTPSQSVLLEGEREGERRKAAVTVGNECLIFFPERDEARVDLSWLRADRIEASWYNPSNGETVSGGAYPASGSRIFLPPEGWEDAVLILSGK